MFLTRVLKPSTIKSQFIPQQKIFRLISISTHITPNPNFLKFVPDGHRVLGDMGTLDMVSKEYSTVSPLAQ